MMEEIKHVFDVKEGIFAAQISEEDPIEAEALRKIIGSNYEKVGPLFLHKIEPSKVSFLAQICVASKACTFFSYTKG